MSNLTLSDRAYNLIKEKIISYDEGQYLSIREMASEIGMSYTPVREAFQRIEKEGLLKRIPNVGFFVPQIDIRHIEEIFQVRECLEVFVLDKVFDLITAEDLETLSDYVDNQVEHLRKGEIHQYVMVDKQFHMLPFRLYGNSHFIDLIENVREQHLICSVKIARNESTEAIKEHRELIEHMGNKDKERALSTLRTHIDNAKQRMKDGYISLRQWPANMVRLK